MRKAKFPLPRSRRRSDELPWLIFLPGLTADHRLFANQLSHFSSRANCLVWDAPGHGLSRPFALDYSLDDLASMLFSVLEREGIILPILVGQSMGGYLAQAFLSLYPGYARGFVSIDSAPLQRAYYHNWELSALRHTTGMYRAIPWAVLKKATAKGCATTEEGRSLMRSMLEGYSKREFCLLAGHGYAILSDKIASDTTLPPTCPTLLLWGENDETAACKRLNQEWARATGLSFVEIPNAGHNSNTDAPVEVNRQIEIFLGQFMRFGKTLR